MFKWFLPESVCKGNTKTRHLQMFLKKSLKITENFHKSWQKDRIYEGRKQNIPTNGWPQRGWPQAWRLRCNCKENYTENTSATAAPFFCFFPSFLFLFFVLVLRERKAIDYQIVEMLINLNFRAIEEKLSRSGETSKQDWANKPEPFNYIYVKYYTQKANRTSPF